MCLSWMQAPYRASPTALAPHSSPAPVGPSMEAPGLIRLWGGLCGGTARLRRVGLLGRGCAGSASPGSGAGGISQRLARCHGVFLPSPTAHPQRRCGAGCEQGKQRGLARVPGAVPCPAAPRGPPAIWPGPVAQQPEGERAAVPGPAGSGLLDARPRLVWYPAPHPAFGIAVQGRDTGRVWGWGQAGGGQRLLAVPCLPPALRWPWGAACRQGPCSWAAWGASPSPWHRGTLQQQPSSAWAVSVEPTAAWLHPCSSCLLAGKGWAPLKPPLLGSALGSTPQKCSQCL